MGDLLVWIDCEMTGLDLVSDVLIEVAALVTDGELNVLGEGVDVVIRPSEAALDQMGDFVRDMHAKSGLLPLLSEGVDIDAAERQVLDYIREYVPNPRTAPLAGNTIGTDRTFLARDMPTLEQFVHYRNVDVSSVKELARRWFPRAYYNTPAKSGNHRALADIRESIEELRYYREAVFVAPPGPSTQDLKRIAALHQGALSAAPSTESDDS
ncbi:MAG: oligoribonuclease [Micropruina sp.]|nr:oligoribonuclease [Micropruina sp.]